MQARSLTALLGTLAVLAHAAAPSAPVAAQDGGDGAALTVEEAVRGALARPALTDITEGAVGLARSEAVREGLWPNPEVGYSREHTFGSLGAAQDFVTISQSFDLSGRRGLRSDAAELRARAAGQRGEMLEREIEAEVRASFYALLAAQLRVAAIHAWVERIEGALEIVSRREAAGDASAYERRRFERELANARASGASRQAEGDRAWARLSSLTGHAGAAAPRLSGSLLPDAPAQPDRLLSSIAAHPGVQALDAIAQAADEDAEAASRWWVPEVTLGAGWTGIGSGGERTDGYVLSGSLTLPLFDRHQDESLHAQAEARLARGEREHALQRARGAVRGHTAELLRLVEAARRFRQAAVEGSTALIQTAEAGYAGDELGILELLDGYRGALEDQMTALDLELAAREAQIELLRMTGSEDP